MATLSPRLNISFDVTQLSILSYLAKQERKPLARVAKELVLDALERREDLALAKLAHMRETQSQYRVSHQDAWK